MKKFDQSVLDFFDLQFSSCSRHIALEQGDVKLSYEEVQSQSSIMANYLHALGVDQNVIVAVYSNRSLYLPIIAIAIMKAGGIYLPIDASFPRNRLETILTDSQASFLVNNTDNELDEIPVEILKINDLLKYNKKTNFAQSIKPVQLAYIIYTSGSTGKPKGVMIKHAGLTNLVQEQQQLFRVGQHSRVAQVASPSFDASISEIFITLCAGGTLVMPENIEQLSGKYLYDFIQDKKISCITLPPSIALSLPQKASLSIETLVLAGEKLTQEHINRFSSLPNLINAYGPTEATVCTSVKKLRNAQDANNIGHAINNMTMAIVDENNASVDKGIEGEIVIAGIGLCAGYLNQPQLSQQAFFEVIEKDDDLSPGCYYKTGDIGKKLENNDVVILGRKDEQIKWHGFRIDPVEIENRLLEYPNINNCKVMVLTINDKEVITACIATKKNFNDKDLQALRHFLAESLPKQICPQKFIITERLPLTHNGKIDKKKLIEISAEKAKNYKLKHDDSELSDLQIKLVAIWRELFSSGNISICDDFYDLGGHSLLESNFVFLLQDRLNIYLPIQKLHELRTIQAISNYLRAEYIDQQTNTYKGYKIEHDKKNLHKPFPLTEVQQAYLFGRDNAFAFSDTSVHVYFEFELAEFDVKRLETAVNMLIERHEALRIIFTDDGQQQIITQPRQYQIKQYNTDKNTVRKNFSHRVYNPKQWPLFSLAMTKQEDIFCIHFDFDALIIDGLSLEIFFHELNQLYQNINTKLAPLEINFRDYVLYYNKFIHSDSIEYSKQYWLQRLNDLPERPQLPIVHNYQNEQAKFLRCSKAIKSDKWGKITRYLKDINMTTTAFVACVFASVLAKWSRNSHFLLNLTIFNRLPVHEQIDHIIGDFSSILLLEIDAKTAINRDFLTYLEATQTQLRNDLNHKLYSGIEVLRALRREKSNNYLAPIVFTSFLHESLASEKTYDRGIFSRPNYSITQSSQVWLDCKAYELDSQLMVEWDYLATIFPAHMIDDMHQAMIDAITYLAENLKAWQQPFYIPLPAKQQVRRKHVNATQTHYDVCRLEEVFIRSYKKHPANTAVITADKTLTYEELYKYANVVAQQIQQVNLTSSSLVAIFLRKGWEQVVACLGVLMSGYAYLPIDPNQPSALINELLEFSQTKLIITCEHELDALSQVRGGNKANKIKTVLVDKNDKNRKAGHLPLIDSAHTLAYVIFTSGSTGKPKGVMVNHAAAVNTILSMNEHFAVNEQDVFFGLSHLSFDLSVYDIFAPLAVGGTICIPSDDEYKEPSAWQDYLATYGITIWNSVPTLMQMLVEQPQFNNQLRLALLSGDKIPVDLPSKVYQQFPAIELISLGGATEAGIWSIYYPIKPNEKLKKRIPYGKPLPNQAFYIVDDNLNDCPDYVAGDIYIAGASLAEGYYHAEALSADYFIYHPHQHRRIYRTGDIGRYLPDGNIEILGRKDAQVKIGGYRVELGEVEAKTLDSKLVDNAVAIAMPSGQIQKLYLFIVTIKKEFPHIKSKLYHYLQKWLPSYMLPKEIIWIKRVPLTGNGKVAHKKLQALLENEQLSSETTTITDDFKADIARRWQKHLNTVVLYLTDDFFKLGGDSLSATRVINEINRDHNVRLNLSSIFNHSSLDKFSSFVLEKIRNNEAKPIEYNNNNDDLIPLSHGQMRLYFLNQLLKNDTGYHLQRVFKVTGKVHIQILRQAIDALAHRHEILRTRIVETSNKELCQLIQDKHNISLKIIDQGYYSIKEIAASELRNTFNFNEGPLIRFKIIRAIDKLYIIITLHHIIADAWSLPLLFNELAEYYAAIYNHMPNNLEPLSHQYRDYACWQKAFLESEAGKKQIEYWQAELRHPPQCINLPKDNLYPTNPTSRAGKITKYLSKELRIKLKNFCYSYQITPYMLLINIFAITLHKYTGDTDIIIGSPIANRDKDEWKNLIGFFVNTIPIRFNLSSLYTLDQFIRGMRRKIIENFDKQNVPLNIMIDNLKLNRDNRYNALFQVMFDYQHISTDNKLKLEGCMVETVNINEQNLQFDITLDILETKEQTSAIFIYNCDIFDEATIDQFAASYEHILSQAINKSASNIKNITTLPVAQTHQYKKLLKGLKLNKPESSLVELLFKNDLQKAAVIHDDLTYRYDEIYTSIAQLSSLLNSTIPGSAVGLMVSKSVGLISIILALWKNNNCIVPIDVNQPMIRPSNIINNLKLNYLITDQEEISKYFRKNNDVNAIDLFGKTYYLHIRKKNRSTDLYHHYAYILHTSGTTGKPKPIMIEHERLLNKHQAWRQIYQLASGIICCQLAQPHFDVFIGDVIRTLCNNGCLLLVDDKTKVDMQALYHLINTYHVNFAEFVPQHLKQLCAYINSNHLPKLNIDTLVIGSDKLTIEDFTAIKSFCEPTVKLYNSYGTTETCIDNTLYLIEEKPAVNKENNIISIGKALPGEQALVVDTYGQLVPPGVTGELIIKQQSGTKNYKTGDQVKYDRHGRLFFVDRHDDIIKLNGYRINSAEILAVIYQFTEINQAIIVKAITQGRDVIIAYLKIENQTQTLIQAIDNQLRSELPDYMVPKRYLFIDHIPLNRNGKLDITKLPPVVWDEASKKINEELDEKQRLLKNIWTKVLDIDEFSIDDNYFSLGGDSITSITMISMAREKGISLDIGTLFRNPTIRKLSTFLQVDKSTRSVTDIAHISKGSFDFTSLQKLFFQQKHDNPHHYNQSIRVKINSNVSLSNLKNCFMKLARHYDIFRIRYRQTKKFHQWQQYYINETEIGKYVELYFDETLGENDKACLLPVIIVDGKNKITDQLIKRFQHRLNIIDGPLCFIIVVLDSKKVEDIYFIAHHLIVDMLTWQMIISDLNVLNEQLKEGQPLSLLPLVPLKQWTKELIKIHRSDRMAVSYWQNAETKPDTHLPYNSHLTPLQYGSITKEIFDFSTISYKSLLKKLRCQAEELLLVATVLAIATMVKDDQIKIYVEGHGRNVEGMDLNGFRCAGWLTHCFPLILSTNKHATLIEKFKQIKEYIRNTPKVVGYFVSTKQALPIVFNFLGIKQDEQTNQDFVITSDKLPGQNCKDNYNYEYLSINVEIIGKKLSGYFIYNPSKYQEETVRAFIDTLIGMITSLVDYAANRESIGYTPSDFPLIDLTQEELDELSS